jgi:UDP-N-acetyl-D-mannosaminuronate dehydrogenase
MPTLLHNVARSGGALEGFALTDDTLAEADCVFVHTAHTQVDWGRVSELAGEKVVDSRGILHAPTPG